MHTLRLVWEYAGEPANEGGLILQDGGSVEFLRVGAARRCQQ
jgi:hypothetical protein